MNRLIAGLTTGLHERDDAVRLGLLASMAGESLFLLGPPGVGKSLIARRLQMVFTDAKSFSYLMGRFSTPDEVFGPLSIQRLKQDDRYERVTTDYLPDADVVFLDEIWKASAPIRNALLTALNERLYRNGSQEMVLPLKVFIGASNELPEDDESAAAFWDRFLIRLVLGPIENADSFRALLADTSDVYADVIPANDKISRKEYGLFQEKLLTVILPESVSMLLLDIRNRLRAGEKPHHVSDRRWKKIVRLLRASALLHGRDEVAPLDCAIVRHCIWDSEDDRAVSEQAVRDALASSAGSRDAIDVFTRRLARLDEQMLSSSVEVIEEKMIGPAIYREEYYRLRDPHGNDSHAAATGAQSASERSVQVLIWRGDVDEMGLDADTASTASSPTPDTEAGAHPERVDLFRYDENDQLVGSESVAVKRVALWVLEIDGAEWEIETENRAATTTRSREPGAAEQLSMLAEAEALAAEIRATTERILADRDAIEVEASTHLFVARVYAKVITDALEAAAEELVRSRLAVEQVMAQLRPIS